MARLFVLAAGLALAAPGCAGAVKAQVPPTQLAAGVRAAELARDGHSPFIGRALGARQRSLRLAALRALARTAEVGTSSRAVVLLGDPDHEVASWAAFTLGAIGEPAGEAALSESLGGLSVVPAEVLRALGRIGTASTAEALVPLLAARAPGGARPPVDPEVRAAAALAIGLIAKRLGAAVPAERILPALTPLLEAEEPAVRWAAAYALMRLPSPRTALALIPALGDRDPELRASAVRGLGAVKAAPQVLDAVMRDPDWRVRVEVARALGAIGAARVSDAPPAAIRLGALAGEAVLRFDTDDVLGSGRATHVVLAVIEAAVGLGAEGRRVLEQLEQAVWREGGVAPAARPDVQRVRCQVAFALDRLDGEPRRVRSACEAPVQLWRRDAMVARLLAPKGGEAVPLLLNMTLHQDPRVRLAAVEALGEVHHAAATEALVGLLAGNDPFMLVAAADALSRPGRPGERPADLPARLAGVLPVVLQAEDPGLAAGLLDAIGALGAAGRPLLPELEALARDPRPAVRRRAALARGAITGRVVPMGPGALGGAPGAGLGRAPAPRAQPQATAQLRLETVRGEIVLELYGRLAPQTTAALVQLANAGFYDGKTFHRVLGDFVAQGGCPRGDGWGGPGFAVPDETSPLPFTRGAVGIATSGRDTGGSQLFVMHAYHPHLDGAYTLVGRVVRGIEVVDALQVDDSILRARTENGGNVESDVP